MGAGDEDRSNGGDPPNGVPNQGWIEDAWMIERIEKARDAAMFGAKYQVLSLLKISALSTGISVMTAGQVLVNSTTGVHEDNFRVKFGLWDAGNAWRDTGNWMATFFLDPPCVDYATSSGPGQDPYRKSRGVIMGTVGHSLYKFGDAMRCLIWHNERALGAQAAGDADWFGYHAQLARGYAARVADRYETLVDALVAQLGDLLVDASEIHRAAASQGHSIPELSPRGPVHLGRSLLKTKEAIASGFRSDWFSS